MQTKMFKDGLVWGFVLWLIGYVLGIVLFPFVANAVLGWVIMPIGVILTLWVLIKKVKGELLKLLYCSWPDLGINRDCFRLLVVGKGI